MPLGAATSVHALAHAWAIDSSRSSQASGGMVAAAGDTPARAALSRLSIVVLSAAVRGWAVASTETEASRSTSIIGTVRHADVMRAVLAGNVRDVSVPLAPPEAR